MLGQPRNCSIGFKRPLHHAISIRNEGSAGLGGRICLVVKSLQNLSNNHIYLSIEMMNAPAGGQAGAARCCHRAKCFGLEVGLCRVLFNGFMRHTEALSHQLLGFLQVNRNQLADPLLRHRHTKQTVHTRHGHRMVGDDQKPRVRPAGHLIE